MDQCASSELPYLHKMTQIEPSAMPADSFSFLPDIIAYIVIGYLFVTLTVLYLLSRNTSSVDKIVGQSRKNLDIFEENEEYRKAA